MKGLFLVKTATLLTATYAVGRTATNYKKVSKELKDRNLSVKEKVFLSVPDNNQFKKDLNKACEKITNYLRKTNLFSKRTYVDGK